VNRAAALQENLRGGSAVGRLEGAGRRLGSLRQRIVRQNCLSALPASSIRGKVVSIGTKLNAQTEAFAAHQ